MSETTTEQVTEEPIVETTTELTETAAPDLAAEVAKWKAMSRKNEERATENAAAAKRLAEIEEANKTEAERLQARAEAAEKLLAERDAKEALVALVAEIASEKKVPAAILRGATREELEEHADTYLASLPVIPGVPSADGLGNVGDPIGGAKQLTQADLDRMSAAGDDEGIVKAKAEGRLNDVLGIKSQI